MVGFNFVLAVRFVEFIFVRGSGDVSNTPDQGPDGVSLMPFRVVVLQVFRHAGLEEHVACLEIELQGLWMDSSPHSTFVVEMYNAKDIGCLRCVDSNNVTSLRRLPRTQSL